LKPCLFILIICAISNPVTADPGASKEEFVHCFNFGCKSTMRFSFSEQQWFYIQKFFARPALSAWLEKQQIRQAIALMEAFAGSITGTDGDLGGNYSGYDLDMQQDCIDESTNTSHYLQALHKRHLLLWHRPEQRIRRMVWLATHWTAVISETQTGKLFAVDSWYRDNGEPPYIQPLSEWKTKTAFSEALNP
jgi:hypothetical protein